MKKILQFLLLLISFPVFSQSIVTNFLGVTYTVSNGIPAFNLGYNSVLPIQFGGTGNTNGASSGTNVSSVAAGGNVSVQTNGTVYTISVATNSMTVFAATNSTIATLATNAAPGGNIVTNTQPSAVFGQFTFDGVNNLFSWGGQPFFINQPVGQQSTFVGYNSGNTGVSGTDNVMVGQQSGQGLTTGNQNSIVGQGALANENTGQENAGVGTDVLRQQQGTSFNSAFGAYALSSLLGGSNNIAIGVLAGGNFDFNESSNIDIGNPGIVGDRNIIRIGQNQTNTVISGVISGNGSGLTSLNASQLGSGTVPTGVLPSSAVQTNSTTVILMSTNVVTLITPTTGITTALTTNGGGITATIGFNGASVSVNTATNLTPFATNYIPANGVISFSIPAQTIITNAGFTFALPAGFVPTAYNGTVCYVTNSSGSLITLTANPSWNQQGTWNVTNVSVVSLVAIPLSGAGIFTNAICWPMR